MPDNPTYALSVSVETDDADGKHESGSFTRIRTPCLCCAHDLTIPILLRRGRPGTLPLGRSTVGLASASRLVLRTTDP